MSSEHDEEKIGVLQMTGFSVLSKIHQQQHSIENITSVKSSRFEENSQSEISTTDELDNSRIR